MRTPIAPDNSKNEKLHLKRMSIPKRKVLWFLEHLCFEDPKTKQQQCSGLDSYEYNKMQKMLLQDKQITLRWQLVNHAITYRTPSRDSELAGVAVYTPKLKR
jgi:hypothetical protein